MNNRAVCTIIAKNYIAFARTLAQSVLSCNRDCKVYVLIVDDFEGYIDPGDECFEIVRLTDLKIPRLAEFCFKYNLKELCTATKASLLEFLIREKSIDQLIYLDPDILVTASLAELYEKLDTHDIILTPHLDTDYPDDHLLPDDGHILRAGQFNLGFIAINSSENARAFLNWWKQKLTEKCLIDVLHGYFVDQKFIDFVPVLFERVFIEKDVGYNVGYWNLHSRKLSELNSVWRCNNGPLYFFHFSGYEPKGRAISSHIPDSLARHRFANRRDLRRLFAEYKKLLIENRQQETNTWPYTFGQFKRGETIPDHVRLYYRNLPVAKRPANPFDSEELRREANVGSQDGGVPSPAAQLNAILNSRAWRWVHRYGRFKEGYLVPAYKNLSRRFGLRRAE